MAGTQGCKDHPARQRWCRSCPFAVSRGRCLNTLTQAITGANEFEQLANGGTLQVIDVHNARLGLLHDAPEHGLEDGRAHGQNELVRLELLVLARNDDVAETGTNHSCLNTRYSTSEQQHACSLPRS
jgi:hypothetical protein